MRRQTRPVIGINMDFVPPGKGTSPWLRLHAGYADSILAAGGLPFLIPPFPKNDIIQAILDEVDGIVLSGGADLDPQREGHPYHPAVRPMPERRESADRLLVRQILKRKLPVLAIGVGMQLVNVALGGELYLHIPEELPRAMPHHDRYQEGPHRHLVRLRPETRLEEIYGGEELLVNSDHHQAVRRLGQGLQKAAVAPDGVIEAFEATDPDWFCIGVQWHPESETATALDMQLFECFVQECVRHSEPLKIAA